MTTGPDPASLSGPGGSPGSDEHLLGLFLGGDQESFNVLVGRWQSPLYHFAYRFLGQPEEARDVCQEAFLRVYRRANRFRDGARFSTWLYQIALNLCRDIVRRRQRWGRLVVPAETGGRNEIAEAPDEAIGAEEALLRERQRQQVRQALNTIPADQREVLVMKEFQGLKFRQIAEILGCPESTVKSRMYYGLANLRDALGDHPPGERH
jgi:RNA polymerase sigma-70 factor (ECF subfamily)